MGFAEEVRRALAVAGMNQRQLSAAMPFSRPKISEMCNGHYLPSDETARRMIEVLVMDQDRVMRLLREARAARNPVAESSWNRPLPLEIASLLRAQVSAADVLPYKLPGSRPVSLSTLYVRQELGSGIEETTVPDRMPEIQQPDDRDPGWRSRNPERFRPLLGVRPPSRPIRAALDAHDHLLVTGGPGQGKPTLALRLSAEMAAAWDGGPPPITEPVIPLRLPARELAARLNLPFADAIAESVLAEYGQMLRAGLPSSLFAARVEGARWLLLVDAVDAVDEVADAADRDSLINNLARWASEGIYRFLVTSRPLEGAGLAPLHRVSAARFELLPFDLETLRLFAEHWFESAEASHQFLDQVRQGQLEDLVQVPLLAAIAAIVFEQHRDRSLPDNKYGMYQDYLEYLGSTRVHPDMTDLLEHLGLARVEEDAPLLQAAHSWRPGLRSSDLVHNLLATGVLVMRAGKLQFLHHSFAEHLAATAKARQLPAPFDAEDPLWRKALHATRYGWSTDHARDVLVHYMHLNRGEADAVLTWLHENTAQLQEVAADLLARRAPVSRPVLQSFLDMARSLATTSAYWPEKTLRRATQAAPAEWLHAICSALDAPWESRVEAASALCRRQNLATWNDAVALLCTAMNSGDLPLSLRLRAAQSLATAGVSNRQAAAEGLKGILSHPMSPDRDRRAAAVALAELGPQCRTDAVAALVSTLDDCNASVGDQVHAAAGLAEIGIEFHDRALAVFRSVAESDWVNAECRQDAALALGALGPAHLEAAAASLEDMMVNQRHLRVPARSDLALAIAKLGPVYVPIAARLLNDLAGDPWDTYHYSRYVNATNLAGLGSAYHADAANHLRKILADPAASPNEKIWAAKGLTELGPDYHPEAEAEFRRLNLDPIADGYDRWGALAELAELGHKFRDEAVAVLRTVLAEQAHEFSDRYWFAAGLTRLGPEFHRQAASTFETLTGEVSVTRRQWHVYAARMLVQTSSGHTREVVAELRSILRSPIATVQARVVAALELSSLAPEFVTDAAKGLPAPADMRAYDYMAVAEAFGELGKTHVVDLVTVLAACLTDRLVFQHHFARAAAAMACLGSELRVQTVRLLQTIIEDNTETDFRHAMAAGALNRFGPAHYPKAEATLVALVTDPEATVLGRSLAAEYLARSGDEIRDEAIAALRVIIARPVDYLSWTTSVETLARLDAESHRLAVADVRAILVWEPQVRLRRAAALCLARLGFPGEAIAELRIQAFDPGCPTEDRIVALWELARLDPFAVDQVASDLTDLVTAEPIRVADRCRAAGYLVQLDRDGWQEVCRLLAGIRMSLLTNPHQRWGVVVVQREINAITSEGLASVLLDIFHDPRAAADVRAEVPGNYAIREYLPSGTSTELARDLAADALAEPSLRGKDEAILQDIISAPEFDHRTKVKAMVHLAEWHPQHMPEVAADLLASRQYVAVAGFNRHYRREAVTACRAIVANTVEAPRQRWSAAIALDELKTELDEATVELFRGVIEQPSCRSVRAAEALARVGESTGVETLRRLLNDCRRNSYVRVSAAKALINWSRVDRPAAVATLDALATNNWRAAEVLGEVAPDYRDKATAHLKRIMTTTPSARIEAARAIVNVDRTAILEAADVLREVAKDPKYARRALFVLGQLARPFCDEALPGLRALMKQSDHTVRWRAAEAMAILRRDLREEASVVAREVARDETAPWHVRMRAATGLAKWSLICRDEARAVLLDVGLSQRPTRG
ncbi:HEAT repeat domain-containing protein [Kibdelosporangium philippinense]|uniref:HEAT repeat domain-containing protein n=1 Tax=Kibdelosporangium philippinense TaxID=211113 RepID=A0ABS8ZT73_9PSEU|nr:HEAT repeat domain-containing protein [Kibdelosporangium philippinense]MCE7009806.1 HEAT repeat domain-containing protein [Kibdelosporangium philippinense]